MNRGGQYKPGDRVAYVRHPEAELVVGCKPYLFNGKWVVDCRTNGPSKARWVWGIYAVEALMKFKSQKKSKVG